MRYAWGLLFALFLLPTFAAADTCPALSLGSRGASVTAVQKILYAAYANFPLPTGTFDSTTQTALKQWQKEHGISQTGTVGPLTGAAMKLCVAASTVVANPVPTTTAVSGTRTLSRGLSGSDVVALQQFLISQNLLAAGNATGFFGALTEAAVQSFQRARNIVSTGSPATTGYGAVGPKTRGVIANSTSTTTITTNPTTGPTTTSVPPVTTPVITTVQPIITTVPVSGPTASLTGNGASSLTVRVGDTVNFVWSSNSGASARSTYATEVPNVCGASGSGPFPWVANTLSGTISSGAIPACWAGHTSTGTYIVTDSAGRSASASFVLKVLSADSGPTATLTANGSNSLAVHVGDSINYAWSSTGGTSARSTYTTESPNVCGQTGSGPFPWVVNTLSGTLSSGAIPTCWGGHTVTETFTVTDSAGRTASSVVTANVLSAGPVASVFEGDSITVNNDATSWPNKLMTINSRLGGGVLYNFAQNGDNAAAMVGEYTTEAHQKKPAAGGEAYFFLFAGGNDILGDVTAAATYANLKTLWANARADGYRVVAFTIMNRTTFTGSKATQWAALNNLILSDRTLYDYVVRADLALPDPTSSTNFADGTHPTPAGYAVIANAVNNALTASVDLKGNGSDGPVNAKVGDSVTWSWTSQGVTSCAQSYTGTSTGAPADWGTSGTKVIGPYPSSAAGSYTILMACTTSSGGTVSDTVQLNVAAATNASCTVGGVTIASGASQTFYSSQSVASGSSCSAVSQTRTCTNGVLSGSASYQYASCSAATATAGWDNVKTAVGNCSAATGNGSTDDTAAMQCHLNYMYNTYGGGIVYVPPGTYRVSGGGLTIQGGTELIGEGKTVSVIKTTSDSPVLTFDTTCRSYPAASKLSIYGYENAAATSDTVTIGFNCPVNLRDDDIRYGHNGLTNRGVDGFIADTSIFGFNASVVSYGANWYLRDTFASVGGYSSAYGFYQGVSQGGLQENHLTQTTITGNQTYGVVIADADTINSITSFSESVIDTPVLVTRARWTSFTNSRVASISGNSGVITNTGSYSVTPIPTGTATPLVPAGGSTAGAWVNVKDPVGSCAAALGNGTDETAAIQCHLTYMYQTYGSGVVFFPPGTYRVSGGGVFVQGGVQIIGSGGNVTSFVTSVDSTVITFDSASCNRPAMASVFVLGYENESAQNPVVTVGENCAATIRDAYIWMGGYALYNKGVGGVVENSFINGYTAGVASLGSNWYVRDKLDSSASHTTYSFLQGSPAPGVSSATNYLLMPDFSGNFSYSVAIIDPTHTAVTVIDGGVTSSPFLINGGASTSIINSELGGAFTLNNGGNVSFIGSYGFSPLNIVANGSNVTGNTNHNISF
ncbi:MAG: hypothetical protein JWM46_630 [Candidatus Kaiserbacteria bacterium]|nr:hypothetical protein [Candidatus Kaiserbacteria bacterium]